VHLDDAAIEIACECRHTRQLVICHGDDDVITFETLLPRSQHKAVTFLPQTIDTNAVSYRQAEALRVCLKIVRYLIFSRKSVAGAGKSQAGKAGISGRVKETKRVPAVPPCVTDMQTRI